MTLLSTAGPLTDLIRDAEVLAARKFVDHSTTEYLFSSLGNLARWVLGGLVLLWLMRLLVLLVDITPLPPRLKDLALRFAPVAELTIAVAFVTSALYELLAEQPEFAWVLIVLMGGLVAFSWSAIYDLLLGVVFRASRMCHVGDLVQVGDVAGRVLELGARNLVLQTRDGDEAVVPYGSIGRRPLRRTQSVSGAYVHSFVLERPGGESFADFKRRVVEASMRCHWASAVHAAKVERQPGGTVEISVFALDADHAPVVEAAVRQALTRHAAAAVDQTPGRPRAMSSRRPRMSTHAVLPDVSARDLAKAAAANEPDAEASPDAPAEPDAQAGTGVPSEPMEEDPSDVMDLSTVLGPKIPPPPPPTWKK